MRTGRKTDCVLATAYVTWHINCQSMCNLSILKEPLKSELHKIYRKKRKYDTVENFLGKEDMNIMK